MLLTVEPCAAACLPFSSRWFTASAWPRPSPASSPSRRDCVCFLLPRFNSWRSAHRLAGHTEPAQRQPHAPAPLAKPTPALEHLGAGRQIGRQTSPAHVPSL